MPGNNFCFKAGLRKILAVTEKEYFFHNLYFDCCNQHPYGISLK